MGLGTATTLSASINPDFGQVEQDPAVLNLSVFETFFPEKRPFFIEDSRTLVADYRPGADVPLAADRPAARTDSPMPAGETVIERPDATTILGATKVTGQGQWLDLRRPDGADRSRVRGWCATADGGSAPSG